MPTIALSLERFSMLSRNMVCLKSEFSFKRVINVSVGEIKGLITKAWFGAAGAGQPSLYFSPICFSKKPTSQAFRC